ncbi:aldo/keto reductase [Actinocorallia aurea]
MAGLGRPVPNMLLGLGRVQDLDDGSVRALVRAALDAGIDYFDHADIYGTETHGCERRFAEAVRLTPAQRERIVLQSKCGIVRSGPYYDFSYEHIVASVEGSLRALRTDYLDVLLLHRPDALAEPDEIAQAFDHLESSGQVRVFGVSNHTPGQIELLRRSVRQPIAVNQLRFSLHYASLVSQGLSSTMPDLAQSAVVDGGVLDYCRLNGVTVQAWSPLRTPTGVLLDSPDHPALGAELRRVAAAHGVTPMAVALAWITRHPARIQPILGTRSPDRVSAAAQASGLPLTRPEWYALFRAAGHHLP